MSTYSKDRVKELMEQQLKKDIKDNTDSLSKREFHKCFTLFQTQDVTVSTDLFKKWKFFITDGLLTDIIAQDEDLQKMADTIGVEEALEEAKKRNIINGFLYLNNDLWLINIGGR